MKRLEVAIQKKPLICDGGMGPRLHPRGLKPGECLEQFARDLKR
jgi:hypothetical protein